MRKLDPRSQTKIANVLLAGQRKISLRGLARHMRADVCFNARGVFCRNGLGLCAIGELAGLGAIHVHDDAERYQLHQFRYGARFFLNKAAGANQNAATNNTGTANAFKSETTGGGNAAVTNSGTNFGGMLAATTAGGNATATNTGSDTGDINAVTLRVAMPLQPIPARSPADNIQARTIAGGNATANNSGSVTNGVGGGDIGGGNATATNSGNSGLSVLAFNTAGNGRRCHRDQFRYELGVGGSTNFGNATVINSGNNIVQPGDQNRRPRRSDSLQRQRHDDKFRQQSGGDITR